MTPGIIIKCPPPENPSAATRLDVAPYSSSSGFDSIIQFSGGGLPSSLVIPNGAVDTEMQIDVIERKPDGSPRVFRALAPIRWPSSNPTSPGTGTELTVQEGVSGVSPLTGVYPAGSNHSNLSFTLSNARGTYVASIATAAHTEALVGPGNAKGHTGPDYLRMLRYFCPFRATSVLDHGGLHEYCGAMVVYITRRVDLDGFICEAMFVNSSLDVPHTSYSGNTNKNPGFIVYSSIAFNPGLGSPYLVYHADTFAVGSAPGAPQGTGPNNSFLVTGFNGTRRHLSAPGTAPGWMFAMHNSNITLDRVRSMVEGGGCAMGFEGRGFSARSAQGWGCQEHRHSDPRDWNSARNFVAERNEATGLVNALRTQITTGVGDGGGSDRLNGIRAGVWHGLGPLDPNSPGGSLIAGHGIVHPCGPFIPWLRLAAMMSSRRVNHAFYAWGTGRPLLPADCVVSIFDPSPDVSVPIDVSLLHHDDMDSGLSNRMPSTQFAAVSPRAPIGTSPDPRYGGRASNGFLGAVTQPLNGPSTRTWNTLNGTETLGALEEDPTFHVGYSHNLAHSARFQHCRDAWIFGLSGIGLEICMTQGAMAASYHNAWEFGFEIENWNFGRATRNLHAWGYRDLPGMVAGSGNAIARRRDQGSKSLGRLLVGEGSQNYGRQSVGWITTRIEAWSVWWQLQAAALGDADYRTLTIGQPAEHNVADLVADFASHIATELGLCSSAAQFFDPTNVVVNGTCDITNRRGAMPTNGNNPQGQVWSVTLDFHEVYYQMALDAVYMHVSAPKQATMQRALMRSYWMHKQGAVVCDSIGSNLLGVNKYPPVSVGTNGIGHAPSNFPPNAPVTAAQLAAGALSWGYRYGYLGFPPVWPPPGPGVPTDDGFYPEFDLGWHHDDDNWLLGLLICMKYGTPAEKAETVRFVARRYGLSPNSTVPQIMATIRSSTQAGSVPSRRSPFDGQFETLVG